MTPASRNARRVLLLGSITWIAVLTLSAGAFVAGMVAHRLNDLQPGGCAALARSPN